ncbi:MULTISPECIES: type II toxin-antitoxin system RelE/ParE family toxin [Testudinibacter]|nr:MULTISPECIES: type II toxin-antitoxin system RelE/ParE family toxin [Testudinibacter]TCV83352.1 plasmid stabilization system protein ParE [Testudinibacter aquarius]
MNKRQLVRSNAVLQDLNEIAEYGRRYFSAETNQKFKNGLVHTLNILCDFNMVLGTARNDIKPNLLMFPYQRYNLYFYRTETQIILLRILRSEVDTLDPSNFPFF